MMGKHEPQQSLFTYRVNLGERVPADHELRRVNDLIDFGFVRSSVADAYGRNGNESVDPAIILKLMFLLFFDTVASERELMRTLPYRLDYLWFLGYGLDDEVPHHSVLSKRDCVRRKWMMEGSFADAVNNHGFKRARWRRLQRQQIQDDLIATVQNVRILLRHARNPDPAALGMNKSSKNERVRARIEIGEVRPGTWIVLSDFKSGNELLWSLN